MADPHRARELWCSLEPYHAAVYFAPDFPAAIDPMGEPFDPGQHEAMSMFASPSAEPDSVIDVIQKGYALHARLLRPARVIVAQASAPKSDD